MTADQPWPVELENKPDFDAPFMQAVKPEGILLCIDAPVDTQQAVIKRVRKWC